MARKTNPDELIHCNVCGEDYSATYRRCPFCGERMDVRPVSSSDDEDFDDGYVFDGQALFDDEPASGQGASAKGGKRLATGSSSGKHSGGSAGKSSHYEAAAPLNWARIITFAISLIIIIAALVIVFTVFYPMVHTSDTPDAPNSPDVVVSEDPDPVITDDPDATITDDPDPVITDTPAVEPGELGPGVKGTITGATGGLNVRSGPGTTYSIQASLVNGNEVTIVEDAGDGWYKISYSGDGGVATTGYIMGIYIAPSGNAVSQPADDPSSSTGSLTPGATGTITGAYGGLNVRSGPGTTYSVQASLVNGNQVTIVEDAGNGWYKISYYGSNGAATTGYIMGTYISVN